MAKNLPTKVVYYKDELNDDFAGININPKPLSKRFKYVHKNPIWRFFSNIVYYIIAKPIITLACKFVLRIKLHNTKPIHKLKTPCFMYGNHISPYDVFIPNIIPNFRRTQILASLDTFSITGIKTLVQMLGAIPVEPSLSGLKKLNNAVNYYYQHGYNIAIFPEAHIWPYFTGVRNFKSSSFAYAVKNNAPVVAFFTATSKPKGLFKYFRKVNMDVYLSDPIYPDPNLPPKQAQQDLRDRVYNFMKDCSQKYSTYTYIDYQPIETLDTKND